MTNLETYRKDIEYYIQHQDYTLVEALEQIYDDYSNQKRIYPKDMNDVNSMIKQDIRTLEWLASGIDKQKRNNYQKHLKRIKELTKQECMSTGLWVTFREETGRDLYECEEDYDIEVLEWLLKEIK